MKIATLLLACFSLPLLAHTMSPIEFGGKNNIMESITTNGVVTVPITLSSKGHQEYIITVDDLYYGSYTLAAGQRRKIDVRLFLNEQNTPETHYICSIGMGKTMNTKLCMRARVYWMAVEDEK